MMNSPVRYIGNNPIRDQLREWAVRGRYLKNLEEKEKERLEWEEEEKRLEEEYGYGVSIEVEATENSRYFRNAMERE